MALEWTKDQYNKQYEKWVPGWRTSTCAGLPRTASQLRGEASVSRSPFSVSRFAVCSTGLQLRAPSLNKTSGPGIHEVDALQDGLNGLAAAARAGRPRRARRRRGLARGRQPRRAPRPRRRRARPSTWWSLSSAARRRGRGAHRWSAVAVERTAGSHGRRRRRRRAVGAGRQEDGEK